MNKLATLLILLPALACGSGHDHDHRHDATVNHSFRDAEGWADHFDDPERAAWQKPDELVRALAVEPGTDVADIGAGTGYFTVRLAAASGDQGTVYGVDVEPAMVDYLRQRAEEEGFANIQPILAAPDDPGLPDDSVDLVFVCNTWHHIDDRLNYLDRLGAAVRPGGRVTIVDFREGDLPVGPPEGMKLSREAVIAELAEGGWSLDSSPEILPHQYVLVFKR